METLARDLPLNHMTTAGRHPLPQEFKDGLQYQYDYVRPIPEKDSIFLPVTSGCSYNRCRFCVLYQDRGFFMYSPKEIEEAIIKAAEYKKDTVFLLDGDPMVIPKATMLWVVQTIEEHMPWVKRVSTFCDVVNLKKYSVEELRILKDRGMSRFYVGLESGDDETLKNLGKRSDSAEIKEQCLKIKESGIELWVTFMLGIAGVERSYEHAISTARLLTQINPTGASGITYIPVEGTKMYDDCKSGKFKPMTREELLPELEILIKNTMTTGLFKIGLR